MCLCNAIKYKFFVKNIKSISLLLNQIDNFNFFKLIDADQEGVILNRERKVIRILMKVHLSSFIFNVWQICIMHFREENYGPNMNFYGIEKRFNYIWFVITAILSMLTAFDIVIIGVYSC